MNIALTTSHFLSRTPLLARTILAYVVLASALVGINAYIQSVTPVPPTTPLPVVAYTPPVETAPAKQVVQGSPQRIQVDRLSIDLPVQPGTYDPKTGEWTLSNSAAFFATMTDQPNDTKGSTFIYGHNRRSVFAALSGVKAGDTVKILTDNGHTFTYTYTHDASVHPNVTDILYAHTEPPQLVLMTCEGTFSVTRRIMYFTLTGVDA